VYERTFIILYILIYVLVHHACKGQRVKMGGAGMSICTYEGNRAMLGGMCMHKYLLSCICLLYILVFRAYEGQRVTVGEGMSIYTYIYIYI
jgi:hypothetical protein